MDYKRIKELENADFKFGIENIELQSPESQQHTINKRGMHNLHVAVSRGNEDQVLEYLQSGESANCLDFFGNTPLHYCGHREVASLLIDYGADPLARNKRGDTPLDLMTRRGVESQTILFLRETISSMDASSEDVSEPLLPKSYKIISHPGVNYVKSLLIEFCVEIGLKRFLVVVFIVLLLSLYFAFVITGFSKQKELRIPIIDGEHKVEL